MQQRSDLLRPLIQHEELFNGTLGDWQDELVSFELKKDARPYHSRVFPIVQVHIDTDKEEVEWIVEI